METIEHLRTILRDSLQLGDRASTLEPETRLLGTLPELDSMAVLSVISALEEGFGITVEDDEISADTFATVRNLCTYIDQKRAT